MRIFQPDFRFSWWSLKLKATFSLSQPSSMFPHSISKRPTQILHGTLEISENKMMVPKHSSLLVMDPTENASTPAEFRKFPTGTDLQRV